MRPYRLWKMVICVIVSSRRRMGFPWRISVDFGLEKPWDAIGLHGLKNQIMCAGTHRWFSKACDYWCIQPVNSRLNENLNDLTEFGDYSLLMLSLENSTNWLSNIKQKCDASLIALDVVIWTKYGFEILNRVYFIYRVEKWGKKLNKWLFQLRKVKYFHL